MRHKSIVISALLGVLSAASTQAQTSTYKPGVGAEGIVYFLPKTAVDISVLVEKTTYTPGDYARFAARYLRLPDVPTEPQTTYRVVSIRQQPVAVADTTKRYVVKLNSSTIQANMTIGDNGCLQAINAEPRQQPPVLSPFVPSPQPSLPNPRQFMSEEILAAGSTNKMAELTAREIYDIRENRNLLIKGQADFMPQDGKQMQLMLDRLDLQDRALTSLFQGVTTRDTTEHTLCVCPDAPIERQVLFRLSQDLGMVDADDLSGAPFYIKVEDLKAVPVPDSQQPQVKKKTPDAGIYVNVPGRMRLTIYQGIDPLQTTEYAAPQFGNVELLSSQLFSKRYATHLWLNPLTGAVDRLESGVTPEEQQKK